jgi:hypothetical protein
MTKKTTPTFCLVVDADVAQAAGTLEAQHERARVCRDVLIAIRGVCHRLAWTEAISAEWAEHAARSLFASTWLTSMLRLNKVRAVQAPQSELTEAIEDSDVDPGVKAILQKDRHLVEAALATDSRVISLDGTAHFHFIALASTVEYLKPILWVNPETDQDVVQWLEDGAPDKKSRRLRRR